MSDNRFKYEIDDELVLRVWDNDNPNEENKPFLLQPFNPATGNDWTDTTEITEWIESRIINWSKPVEIVEEPVEE